MPSQFPPQHSLTICNIHPSDVAHSCHPQIREPITAQWGICEVRAKSFGGVSLQFLQLLRSLPNILKQFVATHSKYHQWLTLRNACFRRILFCNMRMPHPPKSNDRDTAGSTEWTLSTVDIHDVIHSLRRTVARHFSISSCLMARRSRRRRSRAGKCNNFVMKTHRLNIYWKHDWDGGNGEMKTLRCYSETEGIQNT